jgi:hypothetical protein
MSRFGAVGVVLATCLVAVAAISGCGGASPATSTTAGTSPETSNTATVVPATAAQVSAALAQAAGITTLPADLVPPLADLPNDVAITAAGQGDCNTSEPTNHPRDCVYGNKAGKKLMVLFGDSHAGMWLPALDLAAQRAGWKMILLFRPGCPVPDVQVYDVSNRRPDTGCKQWRPWAIAHINRLKPDLIVATSMFRFPLDFDQKTIQDSTWSTGLTTVINQLRSPARRIVVLGDIPHLAQSPPECLAAHTHDVQSCSTPPGTYREPKAVIPTHNVAERITAEKAGAQYVNAVPWLCTKAMCFAVIGRIGVYRNQGHISATYARWLSNVVGRAVGLRDANG